MQYSARHITRVIKILHTNDHEDDIAWVTIFRREVIDKCLGRHVKDTFLFPL